MQRQIDPRNFFRVFHGFNPFFAYGIYKYPFTHRTPTRGFNTYWPVTGYTLSMIRRLFLTLPSSSLKDAVLFITENGIYATYPSKARLYPDIGITEPCKSFDIRRFSSFSVKPRVLQKIAQRELLPAGLNSCGLLPVFPPESKWQSSDEYESNISIAGNAAPAAVGTAVTSGGVLNITVIASGDDCSAWHRLRNR